MMEPKKKSQRGGLCKRQREKVDRNQGATKKRKTSLRYALLDRRSGMLHQRRRDGDDQHQQGTGTE